MGEGYLVGAIILAFPLALLYRSLIPHTSPHSKDVILTLTGILLYILCFGTESLHLAAIVMGSYLFMCIFGISVYTCVCVFLTSLIHLLYGYISVSDVNYTITWTLIHCSAILKVIGYFIDMYDAKQQRPQSLICYTAYVLFPFTSLVGPQFQYSRYVKFREMTEIPASLPYSFRRVLVGVVYIAIFYTGKQFTSADFLISSTFQRYSLPSKLFYVTFWSKWLVTKYCGVWCLAEAAAAITGIGKREHATVMKHDAADLVKENCLDSSGIPAKVNSDCTEMTTENCLVSWDGISNVHVRKFELSLTIQDELSSFNVQVHHWVKRNVYKRCKVFNNPFLSRILSLFFLYLWHGIYIGFLNLFIVEALGISSEQAISRYISRDKLAKLLSNWAPDWLKKRWLSGQLKKWLLIVPQYILKNMCVGYGLVGFALRSRDRCHVFYGSVYYCFHWAMLLLLLVDGVVVRRVLKKE